MNRYKCKVGTPEGKTTWLTLQARDEKQVHIKLLEKEYYIFKIEQEGRSYLSEWFARIMPYRVSSSKLLNFSRQLLSLQKAGLTITDALDSLAKQTDDQEFKQMINDVKNKIEQGMPLSSALATHDRAFSPFYTQSIYAGEKSGSMEEVLRKIVVYLEKRRALRQKLIGALAYPAALAFILVLVLAFLFLSIIPKFIEIFEASGVPLPWLTRTVLGTASWFQNNWVLLVIIIGGIIYEIRRQLATETGRYRLHNFALSLPLIGNLIRKNSMEHFAGTLSTLTGAGIPLMTGLDVVRGTIGNVVLKEKIKQVEKSVLGGMSLSDSMQDTGEFPEIVTRMVSTGEKTGELSELLHEVSELYSEEIKTQTTLFSTVLEPAMILIFGIIIIIIFLAVFIPILQMSSTTV